MSFTIITAWTGKIAGICGIMAAISIFETSGIYTIIGKQAGSKPVIAVWLPTNLRWVFILLL